MTERTGSDDLRKIGRELARSGRHGEAIDVLSRSLESNPDDVGALDLLGFCYYMRGRFEEARACCERSLTLRPDGAYAHKGLGLCLARLNEPEAGLNELHRAVELNPGDFDTHHDLAVTLLEVGRWKEARRHFRRALELDPKRRNVIERALARISALEKKRSLARAYLALPFALLIVVLFPYRSLFTETGPWYLLPLWLLLAHLLPGLSYALTGLSFRGGRVLMTSSRWVYGRLASIVHLQAGFLVALAEETVFRYALLFWLAGRMESEPVALVLTSLLFALAHVRPRRGFGVVLKYVDLFLFGLILGSVTLATRSIYPALLLHGMRNYILRCLVVSKTEYAGWARRQRHGRVAGSEATGGADR